MLCVYFPQMITCTQLKLLLISNYQVSTMDYGITGQFDTTIITK